MAHLINYVKNRVELDQSDGRDSFTVYDVGSLKSASIGRGIFYSWVQEIGEAARLSSQFAMPQRTDTPYEVNQGNVRLAFDPSSKFPCSGIIARTLEGFIIAPTLKLEPTNGQTIILMMLSPTTSSHGISVEKNILTIPNEESTVTVTTWGGELHCQGTISDHSKAARIVLNRNPMLPVYPLGFNETLSEIRGKGPISAIWKPVTRTFEEIVVAFRPVDMGPPQLAARGSFEFANIGFDRIASNLNAFEDEYPPRPGDYVIGEGNEVIYTIRLAVDRGLGRHASDETRLMVS